MDDKIQLLPLDITVLAFYFLIIFAAGIFAMFRSNRNTVKGYFLAGRYMTWLPVGASLFASNIGSEHFIGLAGSGAAQGIAVGAFEFNAAILLQLLGWVFLPVYISSRVCTLPDYMKKRFGGSRIQLYLTVLSLLLYIFTKISVNLYSGSLFIEEALGWNIWYSILFILAMTAVITLTGGLTAVLYTDLVQCIVMLVGAIILTAIGFHKIGGFKGLLENYGKAIDPINATSAVGGALLVSMSAVANAEVMEGRLPSVASIAASPNVSSMLSCSLPSPKAFVMLRSLSDSEMPWLGFLFGQTPASIWYWCADQMMVQRVLAAKDLSHAQGATLMAGFIKLIPIFVMVMPGMISRVLYPESVGCSTAEECMRVCRNRHGCSDWAYPKLVMGILPQGMRGLMLAVMLAALMSDLTSIFNSSSTLFTVDIYTRIRKRAGNRELMIVGRLFVLVMVGVSILWVPVIQSMQGGQLYIYIQSIAGFLAPPIASVYVLAILWKRNNELGAFTGLVYGFLLGVTRMVLDFVYADPVCGEVDTRPWIVANVHYMYFAMFSFFSTGIIMAVVSLCSTPPTEEQVRGLTFWTRHQQACSGDTVLFDSLSAISGRGDHDNEVQQNTGSVVFENEKDPKGIKLQSSDELDVIFRKNDSYVNTDDDIEQEDEGAEDGEAFPPTKKQIISHVCEWICGLTERPCPVGVDDSYCCCLRSSEEEVEEHVYVDGGSEAFPNEEDKTVFSMGLEQKRSAKIGLYIGLVLISCVTVFLYLFFTFYFGDLVQGPVPIKAYASISEVDVIVALDSLQKLGIVTLT